jgi:hypothetical protein
MPARSILIELVIVVGEIGGKRRLFVAFDAPSFVAL